MSKRLEELKVPLGGNFDIYLHNCMHASQEFEIKYARKVLLGKIIGRETNIKNRLVTYNIESRPW